MTPDRNCTLCRLHQDAKTVCLLGKGPKRCDVMVIGEAPGKEEDEQGVPFVGKSGRMLREMLEDAGLDPEECFITNAVSCRPPENRQPTKGEIKKCKQWLDYQIAIVKPKFVLLLGNTPLQSITGKEGITRRRGRPFEQDGIIFLPAFHPAFILRDETQRVFLEKDLKTFASIVKEGEIPREENVVPRVVLTWDDVDEMIAAMKGTISCDLETTCLYPWQKYNAKGESAPANITFTGIGTSKGEFSIPHPAMEGSPWSEEDIDEILGRIEERLRHCFVVWHNGKFDCLWLWVKYGREWRHFLHFDTMLAHYALDENSRHGLKELAQRFCGAPDWDIDKDDKRGNTSIEKLALYHGHDLYYTRMLFKVFTKMLRQDEQIEAVFDHILMPMARMFTAIEYDGVHVDIEKFDDAEELLTKELATSEEELKKYGNINWGSTKQLSNLLYNELGLEPMEFTKTGNPSCSESAINQIDHPCTSALRAFKKAKQQKSFFIEGWKPFLHKRRVNGSDHYFLHPSFKLHGTVTGRPSCENPNLQQVPRDPRIRSLISAPPGWTLVEFDLSQIELRIAAELANETTLLNVFATGGDAHWLTAMREIERSDAYPELVVKTGKALAKKNKISYSEAIEVLLEAGADAAAEVDKEWKELRKKAKAVNFGYLYGMWWKKFKMYARDNYGVEVTDEQAEDSRKAFFSLYPKFETWHKRQRNFARRNGYVRSLSGRKRRLPKAMLAEDCMERREAERQAINSPVQSFASELNLMSAIQITEEYDRSVLRLCGTVHDAILAYIRNDKVLEIGNRLLQIMRRPALMDVLGIELNVPIEAEAKVGSWSIGIDFHRWSKQNAKTTIAA